MWKRRIAWIIVILAALTAYIFTNGTVTLAILTACVVSPVFSLLLLAVSGRKLEIALARSEARDGKYAVGLRVRNRNILPVAGFEAEIRCTNLRTGENESVMINRSLGSGGRFEETLDAVPGHSGVYEIRVSSIRIYDPMHIWSRRMYCKDSVFITALPEVFDVQLQITSSASEMPESDRYIEGRMGNDPGEVRSIREYVMGDPVRNIHWKLSEKTDRLLVKELGEPVLDNILVILDTSPDVGLNPDALESMAQTFASIASAIRSQGLLFTLAWTDPATGIPVFRRIQTDDDLTAAADEYLAVPATTASAFEMIERGTIESRYAHLVVIGSQIPAGIDTMTNGCNVTLLLYGAEGEGRTQGGVSVIGFNEKTYRNDFAAIEV